MKDTYTDMDMNIKDLQAEGLTKTQARIVALWYEKGIIREHDIIQRKIDRLKESLTKLVSRATASEEKMECFINANKVLNEV